METRETNRIVAVSIETTGMSELEHEIIEIGAVKLTNGVLSDQFEAYVKPKRALPESVIKLTGITNQIVESASGIETVMKDFLVFTQDHIVIAFNAEFHLRFLKKAVNDLNLQFAPSWMDLLTASRVLFPELMKFDLHTLCNRFGIPTIPIKHQVDEAKACALLYRTLMGEMEDRGIPADTFYSPITPNIIIRNVCKYYGVSEEELVGSSRSRRITEARRVAMYLIRRMTNENFVNIGKFFNRNHVTAIYSVKMIEDASIEDNLLDVSIQKIITSIEHRGLENSRLINHK